MARKLTDIRLVIKATASNQGSLDRRKTGVVTPPEHEEETERWTMLIYTPRSEPDIRGGKGR